MIKKTLLIVSTIALSSIAMQSVFASGSMRCGTHIVSAAQRTGPGMYEVLKKCGEPTERFGNTWIYKRGSATYEVHFNSQGQVTRIS